MTETDPFESLRHRKQAEEERLHRLAKLGRQWDRTIRNELRRLGQALWPHSHGLRVLPLHRYRLRHHTEAES